MVDLVFVVDRHLLQASHHHAPLHHKQRINTENGVAAALPLSGGADLVAWIVEQLKTLVDVLRGAEEVKQLLVVDLQEGDFDGELCAVLRKLLKDLVESSGDDASQRILNKPNHRALSDTSRPFLGLKITGTLKGCSV